VRGGHDEFDSNMWYGSGVFLASIVDNAGVDLLASDYRENGK
jgi:hypothetical protein